MQGRDVRTLGLRVYKVPIAIGMREDFLRWIRNAVKTELMVGCTICYMAYMGVIIARVKGR